SQVQVAGTARAVPQAAGETLADQNERLAPLLQAAEMRDEAQERRVGDLVAHLFDHSGLVEVLSVERHFRRGLGLVVALAAGVMRSGVSESIDTPFEQ